VSSCGTVLYSESGVASVGEGLRPQYQFPYIYPPFHTALDIFCSNIQVLARLKVRLFFKYPRLINHRFLPISILYCKYPCTVGKFSLSRLFSAGSRWANTFVAASAMSSPDERTVKRPSKLHLSLYITSISKATKLPIVHGSSIFEASS
jgi:hypothetical protein